MPVLTASMIEPRIAWHSSIDNSLALHEDIGEGAWGTDGGGGRGGVGLPRDPFKTFDVSFIVIGEFKKSTKR